MSHQITNDDAKTITPKTYEYELLKDIIGFVTDSPIMNQINDVGNGQMFLTRGEFTYYHYGCDGQLDQGWGCGYRILQCMISWLLNKCVNGSALNVPSIREIQQTLISIDNKSERFLDSNDWIGALEVFYVMNALYDVPCRIMHITRSEDPKEFVETLISYFNSYGGFVMMAGISDDASKGIVGVYTNDMETYLLVVDPHYFGVPPSMNTLIGNGFIRWQKLTNFVDSYTYLLCFPDIN